MAVVFIPALLRHYCQGQSEVEVAAETVEELVQKLELQFPGIQDRLVVDDRINPTLVLSVDGTVSRRGLKQKLEPDSEVHFLPVIAGGLKQQ